MLNRFELKADELRQKAMMVSVYGTIYSKIERDMQWECMQYHDAYDEHEEAWFTEKEADELSYYEAASYKAYKSVLDMIEKLVK